MYDSFFFFFLMEIFVVENHNVSEKCLENVRERRQSKCFLWARGRRRGSFVGSRAVKRWRRERKGEKKKVRQPDESGRFERESAAKREGGRKYDEIGCEDHQETVNQRDSRFGDCFSNDFISSIPLVLSLI